MKAKTKTCKHCKKEFERQAANQQLSENPERDWEQLKGRAVTKDDK